MRLLSAPSFLESMVGCCQAGDGSCHLLIITQDGRQSSPTSQNTYCPVWVLPARWSISSFFLFFAFSSACDVRLLHGCSAAFSVSSVLVSFVLPHHCLPIFVIPNLDLLAFSFHANSCSSALPPHFLPQDARFLAFSFLVLPSFTLPPSPSTLIVSSTTRCSPSVLRGTNVSPADALQHFSSHMPLP
ncbi:hypothetical protein B0T09DRAFT_63222 [Sordaria sp. MPI-SDFR-AT-0083]|nr:hypothetical protein B0T09DRAFT_63222 [Sordaria sp. MPI-SDFR-AT-0083]